MFSLTSFLFAFTFQANEWFFGWHELYFSDFLWFFGMITFRKVFANDLTSHHMVDIRKCHLIMDISFLIKYFWIAFIHELYYFWCVDNVCILNELTIVVYIIFVLLSYFHLKIIINIMMINTIFSNNQQFITVFNSHFHL
jgi:hypothetical protein